MMFRLARYAEEDAIWRVLGVGGADQRLSGGSNCSLPVGHAERVILICLFHSVDFVDSGKFTLAGAGPGSIRLEPCGANVWGSDGCWSLGTMVPLSYPISVVAPPQQPLSMELLPMEPLSMYPPDQPLDPQGEHIFMHGSQQGWHWGMHWGTHCGAHWQLACGMTICCIGAAICGWIYWGCWTYGVPNATGEPIIAGATVRVPQSDPRWRKLRQRVQPLEPTVVQAANTSKITPFDLI